MRSTSLSLTAGLFLAALLLGAVLGGGGVYWLTHRDEIARNYVPVPERVETDGTRVSPGASPRLRPAKTRPSVEIQYVRYPVEVKAECEGDTETVYVPVPTAIAPPDPVVADDDGVEVKRPLFGNPTVTFTYYDPRDERVEQRLFEIERSPLRYGVLAEAYQAWGTEGSLGGGLGAEVYAGWRNVELFSRAGHDPGLALNVRAGVRARFGQ